MNFFQIFGFAKNKPMRPGDFTSDEAKAADAWLKTVNPLRGMTASRMQNLYDASRAGDTVHLQWLYQEIEKVDPTLLICQQRRTGALAALDWNIKTRNQKRTRRFDQSLAQEQADALSIAFGDADQTNFNEALEHLARAFFRGFAHVLPRWSDDGLSLAGFDCLDQWNFVRDPISGQWYWNPDANAYTGYANCRPIPHGELVSFIAPYHIDYPAMTIYLRAAVGEQGWAKFVERFGIPPVILTMPSDIPSDQVDVWRASAEKVAEGGSGAVPYGTTVNFCDGARGINPFKDFVHNQRELIVLMSTGGLLTSLTESGSGTLAGSAHADTWAEVRRMDSAKIASVLNRTISDTVLDRAFPGRPHLAYFAFDTEPVPSPGEVFDDAAKAKSAGYLIDQADLEERTGYRLVKDQPAQPALPFINKATDSSNASIQSINRLIEKPKNSSDVLAAFAADNGPLAKAIQDLLNDPSKAAADALIANIPSLIPDDPALAAVIAEEMAKQFNSPAGKPQEAGQHTDSQDSQALTNAESDTGYLASANVGLENSTQNWHKCPKCGKFSGFDGHCSKCNFTLSGNDAKHRTSALLDEAARYAYAKPVVGLAYREELGRIDLPVGKLGEFKDGERKNGTGLSKIRAKHDADLEHLPDTLTFGEVLRTRHYDSPDNPENPNRRAIVHKGFVCFLKKKGDSWEIATHYKPKDDTVDNLKAIAEAL